MGEIFLMDFPPWREKSAKLYLKDSLYRHLFCAYYYAFCIFGHSGLEIAETINSFNDFCTNIAHQKCLFFCEIESLLMMIASCKYIFFVILMYVYETICVPVMLIKVCVELH